MKNEKIYKAIAIFFIGFLILKYLTVLFLPFVIGAIYFFYKEIKKIKKETPLKNEEDQGQYSISFNVNGGFISLKNPFRGIFVVGSAGSGKSESIAIPALDQFIKKDFSGIIYDFKFPALANEVETLLSNRGKDLKHYYVNFDDKYKSHKINPIHPSYLQNTSYAREYAQSIISNLLKESIRKPDYWTRSATDILTACIWYLREEHPEFCDIPHLFALITSNDEKLLNILQKNISTQQMTISLYSAMERGANAQISGVIGTLQGAIAQINTPELMHVFSANEVPLNVNDPENPIILTIGNNPTLSTTLSPLCSLILTVATKLMNQPNKHQSFVMLDEAPTVFIPNLEVIPNTGRSNKISTVIMCQDISQLTDGYGKEKADVLFSSCNNHFYGRVSSSHTSEILSKQFGKEDRTFTTNSVQSEIGVWSDTKKGKGENQTIQERDVIKPNDFLKFPVGYFAGIVVESNQHTFRGQFQAVERNNFKTVPEETNKTDYLNYYKKVRADVENILNNIKTNIEEEKNSVFEEEKKDIKFEEFK